MALIDARDRFPRPHFRSWPEDYSPEEIAAERERSGTEEHTIHPFFKVFWIIVAAMLAVLGLLLWHIGISLSLAFRSTPQAGAAAGGRSPGSEAPRYRQLLAHAEGLAAAGDFAQPIDDAAFDVGRVARDLVGPSISHVDEHFADPVRHRRPAVLGADSYNVG